MTHENVQGFFRTITKRETEFCTFAFATLYPETSFMSPNYPVDNCESNTRSCKFRFGMITGKWHEEIFCMFCIKSRTIIPNDLDMLSIRFFHAECNFGVLSLSRIFPCIFHEILEGHCHEGTIGRHSDPFLDFNFNLAGGVPCLKIINHFTDNF